MHCCFAMFTPLHLLYNCWVFLFSQHQHTVTISSGSDSDDSDIIRTTYNTSKQLGTSDEKMSDLISKSDRLLKELKVNSVQNLEI